MIDISKGRYWDEGITLVDGCSPCSPGCEHCWSASISWRFGKHLAYRNPDGERPPTFNGQIVTHPERLSRFNTRKPKVFAIWNDLFHDAVSESFQYEVYREMILNKQNTYLILTKRPENMADFFSPQKCFTLPTLEGIYHGLTVGNQQEADEKIPVFLQVPGKKFLSIEPALSHINIDRNNLKKINLVIYGAETGSGARPIELNWARSMMVDCQIAGVLFFLKQLDKKHNRILDGKEYNDLPWVTK
jgi:protein gp37